jgi:hypothetical protein
MEVRISRSRITFSTLDVGRISTFTFLRGALLFAMGFLSPRFSGFENFRTLYCNPFFRICKQYFYKFQKFFPRNQEKPEQSPHLFPEKETKGLKPPGRGKLPERKSCQDPQGTDHADITVADGKAHI